ncbi:MAG: hypothetical protein II540_00155 [Paludibacteraceae bacterium]|nr:hypothetical protein [Paludibacteraceae bacterium]
MKKLILTFWMCFFALSMSAQTYIDLGLPSGTKWATTNVETYFTYEQAVLKFGNALPTIGQWEELSDYCNWTWTGRGYKVVGPNNKSIFLPAAGWYSDGILQNEGKAGVYCSSSRKDSEWSKSMYINEEKYGTGGCSPNYGQSVRLVSTY